MLAAEVWHWWIGLALLAGGVLASVALIGAYLKAVTSQKHPGRKRRSDADL